MTMVSKISRRMVLRTLSWAALLVVAAIVLGMVPGWDILHFHFSMVMATLVSMASGGVAVTAMGEARDRGWSRREGRLAGFVAMVVFLAVVLVSGSVLSLLFGPCDYASGLAFFVVGPVVAGVTAYAIGSVVGALVPGERLAGGVFVGLFAGSFAVNLAWVYFEPAVSFFNPFMGFFPGPIYEDHIRIDVPRLAFAAICIVGSAGIWAIGDRLVGKDLKFRVDRRIWAWVLSGMLVAAVPTGLIYGAGAGWWPGRGYIHSELSGFAQTDLCVMHYDPSFDDQKVSALLEDCGFRHRQMASFFGVEPDTPVVVYAYRSAQQKRRCMGAGRAEIAKPWAGEIHIADLVPGDFVLGHEIAHVVAGRLADNVLNLPVRHGVVPDMALIEGLAVAASFAEPGPSRHEWSSAMIAVGRDQPLSDLFSTSTFVMAGASTAYTLAGSFIRYLADTKGLGVVRSLASGRTFEEAAGGSIESLEVGWRAFLLNKFGADLEPVLVKRAAGRFSDPGTLRRTCPLDMASEVRAARAAIDRQDLCSAGEHLDRAIDFGSAPRELIRARVRFSCGVEDRAWRSVFDGLASLAEPTPADRIALADAILLASSTVMSGLDSPEAILEGVVADVGAGDEGRAACVRLGLLKVGGLTSMDVIRAMTMPGPDAADRIDRAVADHPDNPVLAYLGGRLAWSSGRYSVAVSLFGPINDHSFDDLPGACGRLLGAETLRIYGESLWWVGQRDQGLAILARAREIAIFDGDRMVIDEYLHERLR